MRFVIRDPKKARPGSAGYRPENSHETFSEDVLYSRYTRAARCFPPPRPDTAAM